MKIQFHGTAADPQLNVLHSGVQERAKTMTDKQTVTIPLNTLKWWRELVDLNPQDLAPRMDEIIKLKEGEDE